MYIFLAKSPMYFSAFILSIFTLVGSSVATAVEIHVGIYAPFSNEQAFVGRNILGGLEIARDQVQDTDINYTFYTLDKSSDSPVTADTMQKFIEIHQIKVLITEGSDSGLMTAPVAKKNNIMHFCMANDSSIADGKNNYIAWNPIHKKSAVLDKEIKPEFIAQYLEEYQSHPVTEAGYAFDVFHIIHTSTVTAMKSKPDFSSEKLTDHVQILATGKGVMGSLNINEKGALYAISQPAQNSTSRTA